MISRKQRSNRIGQRLINHDQIWESEGSNVSNFAKHVSLVFTALLSQPSNIFVGKGEIVEANLYRGMKFVLPKNFL